MTSAEQVETALQAASSKPKPHYSRQFRGRRFFHNKHQHSRPYWYHPYQQTQHKIQSYSGIPDRGYSHITDKVFYICWKRGHIARDCWHKDLNSEEKTDNPNENNPSKSKYNFTAFCTTVAVEPKTQEIWIMDSGVSAHMYHRIDFFCKLKEVEPETTVLLENNKSLGVHGIGEVQMKKLVNDTWFDSVITDVLYVPELKRNLFSVGVITRKGWAIIKRGRFAEIFDHQKLVACARCNIYA